MRVFLLRPAALLLTGLLIHAAGETASAGDSIPERPGVTADKDLRWAGFNRKRSAPTNKQFRYPAIVEAVADVTEVIELPEAAEPIASGNVASVPALVAGCPSGDCTPYYRNRPVGKKNEQKRIMMHNRLSEPEWYRYYRCQHNGYYPTQWAPWPEGWMACRRPHPGTHPYDLFRPPPRNSTGGERPFLLEDPGTPPARQEPERLPEPGSLNVPPPPRVP